MLLRIQLRFLRIPRRNSSNYDIGATLRGRNNSAGPVTFQASALSSQSATAKGAEQLTQSSTRPKVQTGWRPCSSLPPAEWPNCVARNPSLPRARLPSLDLFPTRALLLRILSLQGGGDAMA